MQGGGGVRIKISIMERSGSWVRVQRGHEALPEMPTDGRCIHGGVIIGPPPHASSDGGGLDGRYEFTKHPVSGRGICLGDIMVKKGGPKDRQGELDILHNVFFFRARKRKFVRMQVVWNPFF